MIPYILFPRFFKWLGLVVYLSGLALAYYLQPDFDDVTNGTGLLVQVLVLSGLVLICCSRQKFEDELIRHYRLKSLQWAVVVFIFLRLSYKTIAWLTSDPDWEPQWQVNALLLIYLLFFYYQLYVRDFISRLFIKDERS